MYSVRNGKGGFCFMGTGRQVVIPRPLLQRLYTEQQLSTWAIAKELHCSQDTVVRRLHEYEIPIRTRRKLLPVKELIHLYVDEGLGVKELARRYQCSHTTVAQRLRDLGVLVSKQVAYIKPTASKQQQILAFYRNGQSASWIARRLQLSRWTVLTTLRQAGIAIRHSNKRIYVNTKELVYLYTQRHMSTIMLASLYNLKPSTVAERLKEAGIHLRGNQLKLNTFDVCLRYQQGHSPLQIAEELGCSYSAVRRRLDQWSGYKGARKES